MRRCLFVIIDALMADERMINRRQFSKKLFGTAISVFLLETLFGCTDGPDRNFSGTNKIVAPTAARELNHWALDLQVYCGDLRAGKLTPAEWQGQLDRLFSRIELDDLLELIDFERLQANLELPDLGVSTKTVRFPRIEGLPSETAFHKKVFGMRRGRAIIPHGHSNMASGHMVLRGQLHLRQYDKVRIEDGAMEIMPRISETIGRGKFSSISDDRNNVHWFVAVSGPAYTFDVIMLDLGGFKYDIHNLDMDLARKTSNGALRVPLMPVAGALKKYGKTHHQPSDLWQ